MPTIDLRVGKTKNVLGYAFKSPATKLLKRGDVSINLPVARGSEPVVALKPPEGDPVPGVSARSAGEGNCSDSQKYRSNKTGFEIQFRPVIAFNDLSLKGCRNNIPN